MFAAFGFGGGGSTFSATYRVYPVSFLEKESAERGDKLILPPSALDRLGEQKKNVFFFFNASRTSLLACFFFAGAPLAPNPTGLVKSLMRSSSPRKKKRNET